jgi:MFS superfamily sulfate permease-like transporter
VDNSYEKHNAYEVLTINQGLLFPGIEHFSSKLLSKTTSDGTMKSVIIDMHCVANADYTSVERMEQLLEDFSKKEKKIIFCNLRPSILNIYLRAKLKYFLHANSVEEAIQLMMEQPEDDSVVLEEA